MLPARIFTTWQLFQGLLPPQALLPATCRQQPTEQELICRCHLPQPEHLATGTTVTANTTDTGLLTYVVGAMHAAGCAAIDTFSVFSDPSLSAGEIFTDNSAVSVYPNSFRNSFAVSFVSALPSAKVVLKDVLGREVYSTQHPTENGAATVNISIDQQLPQGLCLLQIKQGDKVQTTRIMKQ